MTFWNVKFLSGVRQSCLEDTRDAARGGERHLVKMAEVVGLLGPTAADLQSMWAKPWFLYR